MFKYYIRTIACMNKTIRVYLSDSEYDGVEKLVKAGFGRTKADFAKTAILMHTCKCEAHAKNKV